MQYETEISALSACRLTRAIVTAILISVPLWSGIGGTVWFLRAMVA